MTSVGKMLEERPELLQSRREFEEACNEFRSEVSQLEEALRDFFERFIQQLLQLSQAHEVLLAENIEKIHEADYDIAEQTKKLQELKALLTTFNEQFIRSLESDSNGYGSLMRD